MWCLLQNMGFAGDDGPCRESGYAWEQKLVNGELYSNEETRDLVLKGKEPYNVTSHYGRPLKLLRELRGLWRLRGKVYCYERGYEPYIYELCVSTDVGSRQTVVRLRWAVEVEIDYWVP
jgi:hypothetical protein